MGRTLRLPGRRCPSEPARPPSALPERHSGPSPSVSFLAPHHSCRPHHPQGRLPSRPEDLIPHSPTSLPQGWAPQLRASPSQTRGPQQSGLSLHPTGEGKDLPRVPSWGNIPKNKGASRQEGALWGTPPCSGRHTCTSAGCLCSGCFPACSEPTPNPDPPRRARALLPRLSQPRAQYHVVDKALCRADKGELATFPHTPAHVHTQVLVTQKTFTHLWQVNF